MRFSIITLFQEIMQPFFETGLISRAVEKGLMSYEFIDLREFGTGAYRKVDDYPYGGESGMILSPEPLKRALSSIKAESKPFVILTSPGGRLLNQSIVENTIAKKSHVVIIAGRYKGVDQRFIDKYVDLELSIGDYILQGGELPALIVVESASRFIGGLLNDIDSANTDSFSRGFLDSPKYTRPSDFEGMRVPDILSSGNHKLIEEWEETEALRATLKRRPDLLKDLDLTNRQKKIIYKLNLEDNDAEDEH